MLNLKKNILMIFITMLIIVVLTVPTSIYASDGSIEVITPGGTATTPSPKPAVTPTPKPTAPAPIASPTPVSQTKLPQTGLEDYTGLIVVTIILGTSAIFAYKKIKDYDKF